jgi:hypothetical protein
VHGIFPALQYIFPALQCISPTLDCISPTRQVSQDNAALGSMDTSALLDGFASAAAPPPPAVAAAAAGGAPGAPRRPRGGQAADPAVIAEAGLEGAGGEGESGVSGEDELEAQYEVCSHLAAVPPAAICSPSPHLYIFVAPALIPLLLPLPVALPYSLQPQPSSRSVPLRETTRRFLGGVREIAVFNPNRRPRPAPRTDRTRRVPHPVLIGHASSLPPQPLLSPECAPPPLVLIGHAASLAPY